MAWSSKRQYCVAKYIMEVEYIGCRTITSQAVWINRFAEFGVPENQSICTLTTKLLST